MGDSIGAGQTYPQFLVSERQCFESFLVCFLSTPEPFYKGDSAEFFAESGASLVHLTA